mmetsp:Transcript_26950/g.41292  ORF Transcript_26950/g.41292 Transcript_26950/m.41292 type:complete len:216 (+) Transcript_26950:95-742(+)
MVPNKESLYTQTMKMIPTISFANNQDKEEHFSSALVNHGLKNGCMRVRSLSESLLSRHHIQVPTKSIKQRKIRFSDIEIREYSIILGDNPSVSCGAPITISWNHDEDTTEIIDVDDFEERRAKSRKNQEDLRIKSCTREVWLRKAGFSTAELIKSMSQCRYKCPVHQECYGEKVEIEPQHTFEHSVVNSISKRIDSRRQKSNLFMNRRILSAYSC